ncbi:thyroid peroxidase-like [Saccostrea cucullata]|uniref:thyroid peroxidase-like n=1 Tax=Saccostrea cuccullata TaxID=36930 RepID=UPI002ED0FFC5
MQPWQQYLESLRTDVNQVLREDVCFPREDVFCEENNIDVHNIRQTVFANLHTQSTSSREAFRRWSILREFSQQLCDLNTLSLAKPSTFTESPFSKDLNRIVCNTHDGPNCDWARTSRYRTVDGTCNNLINSRWGAASTVQKRMIPPYYEDGHSTPRGLYRIYPKPLPNPREISERLFSEQSGQTDDDDKHSLFLWSFGQFVDHDLTFTPTMDEGGKTLPCCDEKYKRNISTGCFPIIRDVQAIEECMPFVRSAPAEEPKRPDTCGTDHREQINELTSFIDCGNVYGNTLIVSKAVDAGVYGLLKSSNRGRNLPRGNPNHCKDGRQDASFCQLAGDIRVNEVPSLGLMHTLFLRFHNILAKKLNILNPKWTSNTIYLETRRIMGAVMQHIIYNHWLPKVIGPGLMNQYRLYSYPAGQESSFRYYDTIDPSILNEFSTAAFRYGHDQIPGFLEINNARFKIDDVLMETQEIISDGGGNLRSLTEHLMRTPAKKVDSRFEEGIRERLFKTGDKGLDLPALNIQRGRDHGLAPYVKYKERCKQGYEGLPDHEDERRNKLMEIYGGNIGDIDLFPGGISEKAVPDGLVGPLFGCIIAAQFQRLKYGDRYWYENLNSYPNVRFTSEQLSAIKSMTFGKILCEVFSEDSNPLANVPADVFKINQASTITCADSKMDLSSWGVVTNK